MTKATEPDKQHEAADLKAVVKFDQGDFDKRLAAVREEFSEELKQSVLYREPGGSEVPLNFNIPDAVKPVVKKEAQAVVSEVAPQSGLLASLALEAQQSRQNKVSADQENQASNQRVHDALERVLKFFVPFIQHVNAVEPAINRTYKLDARSIFANLKWQGALVDARKQGMSESSLLNYVAFSVNLLAPEPVPLKRPWEQFDALLKELSHLKIRALEDLHEIHKRPQQEWLEARLDPALPLQITFKGNYELGKIDVLTRNLADFGQTAFRLQPADISSALLDELGLFLIGRADRLPQILQATPR